MESSTSTINEDFDFIGYTGFIKINLIIPRPNRISPHILSEWFYAVLLCETSRDQLRMSIKFSIPFFYLLRRFTNNPTILIQIMSGMVIPIDSNQDSGKEYCCRNDYRNQNFFVGFHW